METSTLAEVRAADRDIRDTLESLYFPVGGRVTATSVVGCVCIDSLSCTECERILGDSFVAIELAARKKQRRDPPVPVARVDAGSDASISGMADSHGAQRLGPGSHGIAVERSDASISGMADRHGVGSHPPLDGINGPDAAISSMADWLGQGSKSKGVVEGFETAIPGMAVRLGLPASVGESAKELFRKMEEARAWPRVKGWKRFRSECPLAYAACLSIACRTEGSSLSLTEVARKAAGSGGVSKKDIARLIAHIRRRLGEEAAHWQSTGTGISDYVRRFGALVGLTEAELAVALEAARRLEEGVVHVGHNADTVAAGVVCMALDRAGALRSGVKDVAAATGITNVTIYAVCRKLRAHDDLLFG